MPNGNRFRGITTEARTTRCAPMRVETNVDLCSDPFHIIDDIVNDEISPPHGRDAFMSWYFARCPLESISSRDIQNAEEIWRFVSGEPDDLSERAEREQLWRRTRNALDRRKGNAVVAVTIRC